MIIRFIFQEKGQKVIQVKCKCVFVELWCACYQVAKRTFIQFRFFG